MWKYSNNMYNNTTAKMKLNGKLSRPFDEALGTRQGHCKAADHYKVYVNPLLDTLDKTDLGFNIGPITITVDGVADDIYLLSERPVDMQVLLDTAAHYGHRYRSEFGAAKTKLVVVGSDIDRQFYSDTSPWTLNNESVSVTQDNEHLGLIVSGENEEIKNVDANVTKGRKSLFGLLGPAFSHKCSLSPVVQVHLYRLFTCPITRSGLAAMTLRPSHLLPMTMLQKKTLRAFLHLSEHCPVPALYFLLGELPIEGRLHRDVFSLFWCVWSNPGTKVHQVVRYLLATGDNSSRTWSIHIRHLAKKYDLPDPLTLLQQEPWKKETFKECTVYSLIHYRPEVCRHL